MAMIKYMRGCSWQKGEFLWLMAYGQSTLQKEGIPKTLSPSGATAYPQPTGEGKKETGARMRLSSYSIAQ